MRVGRYHLYGAFASGGMAAVHFGKSFAAGGFEKLVAIKVPHPQLVKDPEARAMILDEARIVAGIRSPHVVATLDLVEQDEAVYQVMEYANGPSLASVLAELAEPVPEGIALAIVSDVLEGLHAAHEARDAAGRALEVVHRDVSPQNVIVEADGTAKLLDFGIATAVGKLHLTREGEVRGKAAYMAPEQVQAQPLDRRVDVYAAGVLAFELLAGKRPFEGADFAATALAHVLTPVPDLAALRPELSREVRALVERALEKERRLRFPTALAMVEAIGALDVPRASPAEVAAWLADVAAPFFEARARAIAALPTKPDEEPAPAPPPPAAPPPARPPWRALAVVALAVGAALLGWRFRAGDPAAPAAPSANPSMAVSAPASAPAVVASGPAPSGSVSAVAVADASAPVLPHATATARASASAAASAPPPVTVTVTVTPTASAPLPPCCAGEIRIRLRDCVNNCPAGL